MITINEAVKIAQDKLQQLVPQAQNSLLEEVELNEKEWHITLSFPEVTNYFLANMNPPRKYKLIIVDSETGDFKAMKIRNA